MPDVLPTTDIERAFWDYDRNSVSNCTVAVRWKGAGSPELLRRAFGDVAARHPYLRHLWPGEASVLQPQEDVPLGWNCQNGDEERWLELVESEVHRPFDLAKGPLVRGEVLWTPEPGFVLVVTLPHLVSDGVGAYHLAREVLDRLDSLLSGAADKQMDYRFLRPSSSVFDPRRCQPSAWNWSDPEDAGTGLSAVVPPEDRGLPLPSGPQQPGRSGLLLETLSSGETRALLAACTRHGVSLNSWLTAVLLRVFHSSLEQRGVSTVTKLASAIDFREMLRDLGLSSQDLGMWAGRFHLWAKLSPRTDLATLAQGFQAGLLHILRRSAYTEIVQFAQGGAPAAVPGSAWFPSVKITNHGDLDAQGLSRPFLHGEVTRFQGFTALHRGWVDDLGFGLIASVYQERLHLCFVYRNPGMDPGQARVLADRYLQALSGS